MVKSRVRTSFRRAASTAAVLGLTLCVCGTSHAGGFQVSPMNVNLTARERTGSIAVTNPGDLPLHLEIQAFSWVQKSDGRAVLDATDELLVFPQLLTIPPHERRDLRVATTVSSGERERAYKVSITDVGEFAKAAPGTTGLTIRMQMNVPVFLGPTLERRAASIEATAVRNGMLGFSVSNGGSRHFVTHDVHITGAGSGMQTIFTNDFQGDDVLPEGKRDYRVALPRNRCSELRSLTIRLTAGDQPLSQTLGLPARACLP
jgi:fimbrial chaperone protein